MNDPRITPDFRPELYPRLEGAPAPPQTADSDSVLQRKLALLAAYYRINVRYQKLLVARKTEEEKPLSGRENSRLALQELDRALLARDRLDDEFAPLGMVSSPEVLNGIITNVKFTAPGRKEPRYSTLSMCFALRPL